MPKKSLCCEPSDQRQESCRRFGPGVSQGVSDGAYLATGTLQGARDRNLQLRAAQLKRVAVLQVLAFSDVFWDRVCCIPEFGAEKIKVSFFWFFSSFVQFSGFEGDFKTRAKPRYAANSDWNAFRLFCYHHLRTPNPKPENWHSNVACLGSSNGAALISGPQMGAAERATAKNVKYCWKGSSQMSIL